MASSISQPLTAQVGVDGNGRRTPQTGPPPTVNLITPTPTTATANADQKQDIVVEIHKVMTTAIDQCKEDIRDTVRDTVREVIAEAMASYTSNMDESSDPGVTEWRDVPEKAASEDQEHGYQHDNRETTKLRSSLSDCDKGLGRSLSSPYRKKPKHKTTETLERPASSSPYIVLTSSDDRECLANALQSHAVIITNDVLFTDTNLPDQLSERGFLTDDECITMRGLANKKDRIRTLLSVIKGRNMETIKGFLECLKQSNPYIVDEVHKTYDDNKFSGMRCTLCAFCFMKTKVDITYVVDSIWEAFAIPDGLYNEISHSQKPAGAQEVINFWERLAEICNSQETKQRAKAFETIIERLTEKKYDHIAKAFRSQQRTGDTFLKCHCKVVTLRQGTFSIDSTATTISPGSSLCSSLGTIIGQENGAASMEPIFETVQPDEDISRPLDDLEISPSYKKRFLVRSSSDPSVNTMDRVPGIPPYPNRPRYQRSPKFPYESPGNFQDGRDQDVHSQRSEDRYYRSFHVEQPEYDTESPYARQDTRSRLSPTAHQPSSPTYHASSPPPPQPLTQHDPRLQSWDGDGERADQEPVCRPPVPLCTNKAPETSPPLLQKKPPNIPPKHSTKKKVIAKTKVEGEVKQMKGGTEETPTSMSGEGPPSESSTCGYTHVIYQLQSRDGNGDRADQELACPQPVPLCTNKALKPTTPPLPKKRPKIPPKPSTKMKVIATTKVEGEVKQMKCGTEETPTSMSGEGPTSESSTCGYAHVIYQLQSRDGNGDRADQEPACPPPVPLCTNKARKSTLPSLPKEHPKIPPKPSTKKKVITTTNVEGEVKQMKGGTEETQTSMSGEGPRFESTLILSTSCRAGTGKVRRLLKLYDG